VKVTSEIVAPNSLIEWLANRVLTQVDLVTAFAIGYWGWCDPLLLTMCTGMKTAEKKCCPYHSCSAAGL